MSISETTARKLKAVSATAMIIRGTPLTQPEMPVYDNLLKQYSVGQVDKALVRVQRECEFFNPKAIISRIDDGRPDVEEAWSLVRLDEDSTFVMTDEMSTAFHVAYQTYEDSGDKIAARMAFKEKYVSELANARAEGKPANWFVSWGNDKKSQELPVREAIKLGRIKHENVAHYLPSPDDGVIKGMLADMLSESKEQPKLKALSEELK